MPIPVSLFVLKSVMIISKTQFQRELLSVSLLFWFFCYDFNMKAHQAALQRSQMLNHSQGVAKESLVVAAGELRDGSHHRSKLKVHQGHC